MPSYQWRQEPPTLQEVQAHGVDMGCEAYYWVRGWSFNRPVMAKAVIGARRNGGGDMAPELRLQVPASDDPRTGVWADDFCGGDKEHDAGLVLRGTWHPLEWAGPICQPEDNAEEAGRCEA